MTKLFLLFLLICVGCSVKPKVRAVSISLINNSGSIKFNGLDYAIISEIGRDSGAWQNLLPVYRMPTDTDMKNYQPAQPGIYLVKDSSVVFTPYTPFVKGQAYFLRYYQFGEGNTIMDFIRRRKKLGNVKYMDLTFKQ